MPDEAVILVVDDNEAVREALTDILNYCGFQVLTAEDGASGIALFQEQQHEIDLVILDLVMPGLPGPETLRQLRQLDPTGTVLLSSGYDEDEVIQSLDAAGINRSNIYFLQKPFSLKTVVSLTRSLLQKA